MGRAVMLWSIVIHNMPDCIVLRQIQGSTISMVGSTEVLCPLFDETEILIPRDGRSIVLSLDKM